MTVRSRIRGPHHYLSEEHSSACCSTPGSCGYIKHGQEDALRRSIYAHSPIPPHAVSNMELIIRILPKRVLVL